MDIPKDQITLFLDESCEMAMVVDINGRVMMTGNYWDFNPGYNIEGYGNFGSPESLATIVAWHDLGRPEYVIVDDIPYEDW